MRRVSPARKTASICLVATWFLVCGVAAIAQEGVKTPGTQAAVAEYKAGDVPTYAELDKGEKVSFELHDGSVHTVELVSYGRTSANLLVNGKTEEIRYRPQDMPRVVAGMRIGVDMTKAWSDRKRFRSFGLKKDCRLFLSDASRPVMCNPEGVYPLSPAPRISRGTIWGGGWLAERRSKQKDCHIGFDIYGPVGTKLLAIEDAVVKDVWVDRDYGKMIVVDLEGKQFSYRYLHLMEAFVRKGRRIKRGDEVGLIGQTGYCAYPHLHLQMMPAGTDANAKPAPGVEAVKQYFAPTGTGTNVNPAPYIHGMYAKLDPKRLVDFYKVKLKAVDPEGNRVKYPHYYLREPGGTTYDIGVHHSTAVAEGVNPHTFIVERKKLGLRGERTVTIEKDGEEVTIVTHKEPEEEQQTGE